LDAMHFVCRRRQTFHNLKQKTYHFYCPCTTNISA
jgi:hypothetical protein